MSALSQAVWQVKQEKNDKVSLDLTQVVRIMSTAMVFTGLSIRIARFHSHSRRGAYAREKYTCAGTSAENGTGAYGQDSTVLLLCWFFLEVWYLIKVGISLLTTLIPLNRDRMSQVLIAYTFIVCNGTVGHSYYLKFGFPGGAPLLNCTPTVNPISARVTNARNRAFWSATPILTTPTAALFILPVWLRMLTLTIGKGRHNTNCIS